MQNINVWYDSVSEPGTTSLIVSIDDDHGSSDTLKVFDRDERAAAIQYAEGQARKRGLEIGKIESAPSS